MDGQTLLFDIVAIVENERTNACMHKHIHMWLWRSVLYVVWTQ